MPRNDDFTVLSERITTPHSTLIPPFTLVIAARQTNPESFDSAQSMHILFELQKGPSSYFWQSHCLVYCTALRCAALHFHHACVRTMVQVQWWLQQFRHASSSFVALTLDPALTIRQPA